MEEQARVSFSVDWRWIVAGYCYLVLFHLFPTYLLGGITMTVGMRFPSFAIGSDLDPSDLVMVWLLAGVAIVAFVVGLRSKGFTILEPAAAAMLYAMTITLAFHRILSARVHGRPVLALLFWWLIVIILSVASAWVGEIVQRSRMAKEAVNSGT